MAPHYKKLAAISYCDLTKFDRIERVILLRKIKDEKNGFPYIAKLGDPRYKELLDLRKKLLKYPRISPETRKFVEEGTSPTIEGLLLKLDLK